MDRKTRIKKLLEDIAAGTLSVAEGVDWLLHEMGRGGRILVVDENLLGLERELSKLNYTTYTVPRRLSDEAIKEQIHGRILITNNGEHFAEDAEKENYGLIWVVHQLDHALLAKKIEAVLMTHNFSADLTQVIKV